MIWYWISFALIAAAIPSGLFAIKAWSDRRQNHSNEERKIAMRNIFMLCVFYWLCDLFYMACFIQNLTCKYIFGCLIVFGFFINCWGAISSRKERTKFENISLIVDFLVGVGISIYLIYTICDESLRTIITAILSALFGGLMTLAGVAWTIKSSEKERKANEIAKVKPYFSFGALTQEPKPGSYTMTCFTDPSKEIYTLYEAYVRIDNSNLSVLVLKQIFHDGSWHDLTLNQTIVPGGSLIFSFCFNNPLGIYLKVCDCLGNSYYYKCEMLGCPPFYQSPTTSIGKRLDTIKGVTEISKSELEIALQKEVKHDRQID